jgi:hypothetical protein
MKTHDVYIVGAVVLLGVFPNYSIKRSNEKIIVEPEL